MRDRMSKPGQFWESLLDQVQVEFLSAREHRCSPAWRVLPRTTHDEMLHVLHGGAIEFRIGDERVCAAPGTLILCPPKIEWEAWRVSTELVHVSVVHFQAGFPGGRRFVEAFSLPPLLVPSNFARAEELSGQLCDCFAQERPGHVLKERSLLFDVLHDLFAFRGEAAAMDRDGERVWNVAEFLRAHLSEPITRAELSRQFCMSAPHLAALFQSYMGCGPISFLIRLRLEEARRLLTTSSLSVAQIARRVGYEDNAYFSRLFKESTGVPPLQFRLEHRQHHDSP